MTDAHERVVVTGVGLICALGRDTTEFWANLVAGRSGVRPATQRSFDGLDGVWVGEVEDAWLDEGLPAGAKPQDRLSALALVAAREALTRARLSSGLDTGGERVGVVVGQCQMTDTDDPHEFLPFHAPADSVAEQWGLVGPRIVLSNACAAGANAVGAGRDLLLDGQADVVLAGGTDNLQRGSHLGFSVLSAIADGPTAPYSRSDGLSLGEGAAFLVLETAAHAAARGATVLAEVGGYGLSADGYHATAPDPTGAGPLRAVQHALHEAGIGADRVSYVNGHGTGTPANDAMEQAAMITLFGEDRVAQVPISSTKAALGHSLGASGAIEAVTCVLALGSGTLPPTVNFDGPGPEGFDFVPGVGRPAQIDVTLSNNYAFGGNNCSLVLARPGLLPDRPATGAEPDVVISGLGVVSGFGLGVDAWRAGVRSGRTAIGPLDEQYRVDGRPTFGSSFTLDRKPLVAASLWRQLPEFARASAAVAAYAFRDAGIATSGLDREDVGLSFATCYGPVAVGAALQAQEGTPEGLSARAFSNATVNAAAGAVGLGLVMRGPTTTIATGGASALIALDVALQFIRTGQARRVMLLAVDELHEGIVRHRAAREALAPDGIVRPYDIGRTGTALGAAAVGILLEDAASARERGGKAYARVLGTAQSGVTGGSLEGAAARALGSLLARSGVDAGGVDLVVGSGRGAVDDDAEMRAVARLLGPQVLLTAPASLTGDCGAASGGISLLCAALAVSEGLVPATANLGDPLPGVRYVTAPGDDVRIEAAVATATSIGSLHAAALLGAVR
ncbi:beta-ketoacyl synthase N-terminal-like domain-containing protein [Spongisporangium articulatum]|uniref:Beta-ketoacyl synthase N-terminal-like domain-containing protein n=1 Tax=Spongisporangium articulatum TaxID=3362603 RepID=A0ABW8AR78_9ACTN